MADKRKSGKRTIAGTLQTITRGKRTMPKSGFVLIILLYLLATVVLLKTTHLGGQDYVIGGFSIPLHRFTGVFSSLGNLCLIFLVVFYGRLGFFTTLGILTLQFPHIMYDIFVLHNFSAIPGLFTNLLTAVAVLLIFFNRRRADLFERGIVETAVTDRLTGLPNRFAGREYLTRIIKKGDKFVYVLADINNFKSINDTMGYEVGNKVLIEIANRWRNLADSGETGTFDLVAHISGDEFGIAIQDYDSEEKLLRTINRFKEEIEKKITIDDYDYYVTASFGYAEYPTDAKDLDAVTTAASLSLHDSKRRGHGLILHYTPELSKQGRTLEIERRIREALKTDAVFFHLQPQYDISKKLRGFEALARLMDAEGKPISPMEFIPVAEQTGLVDEIDMCVFHRAAKFLEDAAKKGRTDISISVNISVKHLLKNDFLDEIKEILSTYEIKPSNLEIEITESVMIDSVERAKKTIEDVKGLGIQVAIDDFGTGYSSLSYLHNFPANLLKVDKSFIDTIGQGESSRKYVESIISIGHVLGMEVISEGVEEEEQLAILKEIGCDFIQGFIWGRPLPPEEAEKLL